MVLIDKDGLTEGTVPPTHAEFNTKEPSESEYRELVNTFWWDITYVAKCLARDEFYFAKYMLDVCLHHDLLRKVISWRIGMQEGWQTNPGVAGRWFKRQLDPKLWAAVERTFAGADGEDNWRAMFETAAVFGRMASEVGVHLSYTYPHELERNVTQYLMEIRKMGVTGQQ